MKKVLKYIKDYYILPKKRIIMKKLFISTLFISSSIFAFDISSGLKTLGISAESVGQQLFDYVKEKKTTTVAAAKSYCTQASEYKSFAGISDGDLMNTAINICTEKSKKLLTK